MKNLRKLICVLLAVAMLLSVMPAYAFADPDDYDFFDDNFVEVISVRIEDPVVGEHPAATAELSAIPEDALSTDSVPISWEVYDDGTEQYVAIGGDAVFADGKVYRARPNIGAIIAAVKNEYIIYDTMLLVNELDYYPDEPDAGIVFGPLGSTVIGRIEITVAAPAPGAVPATSAKIVCDTEGGLKSDTIAIAGWRLTKKIEQEKTNAPLSGEYVAAFETGGYYVPDFEAGVADVIASGYSVNPSTQFVIVGMPSEQGFGPVGFEEITSVNLTMIEPYGGQETDLPGYDPATDDWYWTDQTNTPVFEEATSQHVVFFTEYEGDPYAFWYEDETYSTPFMGAFECGGDYYADVNLEAEYGYYFSPNLKVKINGKTIFEYVAIGDIYMDSVYTDTFVHNDTMLIARTGGVVGHNWGERKLTGKEDNNEIYTIVCTACGEKTVEKVPVFADVVKGAFYEQSVLWAVSAGVTNGTGNGNFSPGNKCTRGQVVTFLWRAAGSPEPKTTVNPFTDVKSDGFYYKAVLWAVENNITSGLSATTFGPGKECTRGQVVTFLWRAKGEPAPKSTAHPFTDVKSDGFYFNAMLWAVENNVTNGTSATTFGPGKTCTRGQVVTFLYRAFV